MTTTLCPLCKSTEQTIIRDTLRYDIKRKVLHCSKCDFVFLEDKDDPNNFYSSEDYRSRYGPDLTKKASPEDVFDAYYSYQGPIIKEIEHLLTPNTSVLDVGCSAGQFLAALKGKVGLRVGLELSQNEAEFIRSRHDFKVYSEPIETIKIEEEPFDLVTSLQVVEHVPNPINFIKNLARQVKPGGYLYLELPNLDDALISCYKSAGYAQFYFREPHVSYFTKKTLAAAVKAAGLSGEIKTVQRYNFTNHVNWILTDKPQTNFNLGNAEPKLVSDESVAGDIRNDLNAFIKRVDSEYKALLQKHGVGECLTFLAKI